MTLHSTSLNRDAVNKVVICGSSLRVIMRPLRERRYIFMAHILRTTLH